MLTPDEAYVMASAFVAFMELVTVAPSVAGWRSFQSQVMPSFLNSARRWFAIESKFSVARARMVGPAPERQIPSRPGCDWGVTDWRISVRPGIRPLR